MAFQPSSFHPRFRNGHVQTLYAWGRPRRFPDLPTPEARYFDVAPDARVAVTLTATGMDSLERALGPGVQRVSGRYTATNGDAIVVRVDATEGPRAPERRWSGESVALPRRFVGQVDVGRISRTRTTLATVGAIGALVALNATVDTYERFYVATISNSAGDYDLVITKKEIEPDLLIDEAAVMPEIGRAHV